MKNASIRLGLSILAVAMTNTNLIAQGFSGQHQTTSPEKGFDILTWFAVLELPFLIVCIYYGFKVASALKGGKFGEGMKFLAWGFLVMAVGHLAMQVHEIWGYNIFERTFGLFWGNIMWFIALIITWGLSAIGFYKIYQVAKN